MLQRWYPFQPCADDYGGVLPQPSFTHTNVEFVRFSQGWKGWKVKVYSGSEGFGDFLSEGAMPPVVTRRTADLLRELFSGCALVPFEVEDFMTGKGKPIKNPPKLELFAVDPPILSGALDVAKSEIDWLDEEQRLILGIDRFALRGDAVARSPIFRLAEQPARAIVSEAFREAVEKHKLTGLRFHPLNATWEP